MPEQGGGKGFGRLPFNYRGQRLASRRAAMLHDPTMSSFGVRSGHPFGTRRPDSTGTIAYVLYAIVFRETSGRHTRTLFAVLSFLHGRDNVSSSVFRELYQSHFAPGSCSPVGSSRSSSGRHTISSIFLFFFFSLFLFLRPLFVLLRPPILRLPLLFDSSSSTRPLPSYRSRFATGAKGTGEGTGDVESSILCRVIVRPLSTQPRQIRFGMVFSATRWLLNELSNELRTFWSAMMVPSRFERDGLTIRLTFHTKSIGIQFYFWLTRFFFFLSIYKQTFIIRVRLWCSFDHWPYIKGQCLTGWSKALTFCRWLSDCIPIILYRYSNRFDNQFDNRRKHYASISTSTRCISIFNLPDKFANSLFINQYFIIYVTVL